MYKGMISAEYFRERREALALRGLCTRCGIRPAQSGRRQCFECNRLGAASWMARADQRVKAGLCARCGKRPLKDGIRLCEQCAGREAERSREWRQRHATE